MGRNYLNVFMLIKGLVCLLFIFALTGCVISPICITPPKQATKVFAVAPSLEQARQFYGQGDYAGAVRVLEHLAKQGDVKAMYALGFLYYTGKAGSQDKDIGRLWIRRAAARGFRPAEEALVKITRGA